MLFPLLPEGGPFVGMDHPGARPISDIQPVAEPDGHISPSAVLFLICFGFAAGLGAAIFAYSQGFGYGSIFVSYMLGGLSGIGAVAAHLGFSGEAHSGFVGRSRKNTGGCRHVHIPVAEKGAITTDQSHVRLFVTSAPLSGPGARPAQALIVTFGSALSRQLADWVEESGREAEIVAHDRLAACWLMEPVRSAASIARIVLDDENYTISNASKVLGRLRRLAPDVPVLLVVGGGRKRGLAGRLSRLGATPDRILGV